MAKDKQVDNPSLDHVAMQSYWDKVDAISGDTEVMRTKADYLPKFPNETKGDYEFRQKTAKFTNVFGDIVETLSAKPFSKEVNLSETAPDWAKKYIEDVDSKGNHIHVFASDFFCAGVKDAISWVLVDYTNKTPANATQATEKAMGVRPYWVTIAARDILSAKTAIINGKEQFIHVRIAETEVKVDGYEETIVERVRLLQRDITDAGDYGPAYWQLFEKQKDANSQKVEWIMVDEGKISIDVIPIVPFLTGRRMGNGWTIRPVLRAAADLQIELFQQESGLKYAKESTAFPMLAGNGVAPQVGENGVPVTVPVGPKTVLYAPPNGEGNHGEWNFIEPSSESLRFLADDVKETIQQLRELGRQPLTAQTGNLTVVTTAFAADKANSVIQAWAINLKDALENIFDYTAMWMNEADNNIKVMVDIDFDISVHDSEGLKELGSARRIGDISQKTYWNELVRRNILSPEFDADEELDNLLEEIPGDSDDVENILPE